MELLLALAAITTLFVLILTAKQLFSWRICVLCASIALTWIALLILLKLNYFDDSLIVALLLGQSITGIYYLAEKNLHPDMMVFRLPGLLTLTFLAYWVVAGLEPYALILLGGLWLIGGFLYAYRSSPKLKSTVEHVLACCRDW